MCNTTKGDADETYTWVERAIEAKDAWLKFSHIAPAPLRTRGPRIDALLEKTGWE